MTSYYSENREDLLEVWGKIWQDVEQNKLYRNYDRDFEQYNSDGSITIFISAK